MRTRGAVLHTMGLPRPYAQSRPLSVMDLRLDAPGRGEVLIRVRAAGLCHSDLSTIDGARPRPMPMLLGHESAGEVAELGAGVEDFAVGDHVVTTFVPSCGACEPCRRARPALCEPGAASNSAGTLINGARHLHADGTMIHHHLGVSAFAEYAVVSKNSLVRIDRSLPFDLAAVFGCAVVTGVGAVVNTADIEPDARVAVIGLGGVGLAALMGARARSASSLIAVDLSEEKLALAKELGATLCVNASSADSVDLIREITHGGVDYAFEMAGSAKAMDFAYRVTRRGGTTVSSGLPHPTTQLSVSLAAMVAEERTIKGSYLGSCVPKRDIPRYIEWFQSGRLPVDQLLSGHLTLDRINEGFDTLADAAAVRQIIML